MSEAKSARAHELEQIRLTGGRRAKRTVAVVVAAVILILGVWYIVATFEWRSIAAVLWTVNPLWLLVAAGTVILCWIARTIRWIILLRNLGVSIPSADLYICTAVASGFALITPVQSGEIVKLELLKKYSGLDRFSGYSSFVVERVADLIVILLLGLGALFLGPHLGADQDTLLGASVVLLAVVAGGMFVVWRFHLPGRAGQFQAHMRACLANVTTLTSVLALTIVFWLITAAGWYACLLSLDVNIGYANTMILMCAHVVITILCFIPGAVGASDAGIAILLLHLGQASPQAQAGALILRFHCVTVLALAWVHLSLWPLSARLRLQDGEGG